MSPRRTTKRRGWRTKILGAQSLAAFQLILLALVIVYIVGQFRFLRTANFCLKAELDFKQKTLAVVFSPCATNADATMEAALSASISPKASESSLAAAPRFHLVFSTGSCGSGDGTWVGMGCGSAAEKLPGTVPLLVLSG